MAGTGLLILLDDIATILDDVAVMTKVAAKKTAGVLADDLALNAQQVAGLKADRELPVVWAVAKGSFKNKFILVPSALAISAFAPWAVTPLLILGGAFLCYEGFEKLAHKFMRSKAEDKAHHATHKDELVSQEAGHRERPQLIEARVDPTMDMVAFEKNKIRGAIRTDFILSAEIIVISLGTVATASFAMQVTVLTVIALALTIGVYGLVAGIIKLDDGGLYLSQKNGDSMSHKMQRSIGAFIVRAAPVLMKGLSIVGTAAMFLVGGGILTHGIHWAREWILQLASSASTMPGIGGILHLALPTLMDALTGILAGAVILLSVTITERAWRGIKSPRA